MLEKKRADWEQEKAQWQQWQQEWTHYEERSRKWIKEQETLLKEREKEMITRTKEVEKHENELAKREKELAKHEAFLEVEKTKVMEQYKRAKKLERQGKRREERIEKAQQQLQHQANEHFSVVYTTLQLGLQSFSLPTQTPSRSSCLASSSLEHVESSLLSNSVSSTCPQVEHLRIPLESLTTSCGKPFLKFGKPKVSPPAVSACSECTAPLQEYSVRDCTFPQENENSNDSVFSSVTSDSETTPTPSVEAMNLVSTERDPFHVRNAIIDSGASLIGVNAKLAKKINGKHYTGDKATPTFVWICSDLCLPSETSLPWFNKYYNPHVDWGPLF